MLMSLMEQHVTTIRLIDLPSVVPEGDISLQSSCEVICVAPSPTQLRYYQLIDSRSLASTPGVYPAVDKGCDKSLCILPHNLEIQILKITPLPHNQGRDYDEVWVGVLRWYYTRPSNPINGESNRLLWLKNSTDTERERNGFRIHSHVESSRFRSEV